MNLPRALGAVVVALAGWLVHRHGPLRRFEIAEESMAPTLQTGDYVLTARRRRLRRGTIVVFEHPSKPGFFLVKRVVALPGERLTIQEGIVTIGGRTEPWARDETRPDGDWEVPAGSVFVLGDKRLTSAADSRAFGPISARSVDQVLWRYWPPRVPR